MAALEPLRRKARAVEAQRVLEQEAAVRRWQQSERPALKDFAHTLRETETIQRSEIKQLQQRLREFTSSEVPNQPSSGGPQPHRVTTGFNVIRSRAGADGKPLPTDALRAERQRLIDTLAQLNVEIASAKAELTDQRRLEEQEIWETKLVALQVAAAAEAAAAQPGPTAPPSASGRAQPRTRTCFPLPAASPRTPSASTGRRST